MKQPEQVFFKSGFGKILKMIEYYYENKGFVKNVTLYSPNNAESNVEEISSMNEIPGWNS